MNREELPQAVQSFIAGHIDSAVQLELLLLIHRTRATWDASTVSAELKIDAGWAGSQLALLCDQGLLRCNPGPPAVYEYHPRTTELDAAVAALAAAYADRRVSVISLIYSKPTDNLRAFADAFRLRKREDGDG
jgi:hypothetical protein